VAPPGGTQDLNVAAEPANLEAGAEPVVPRSEIWEFLEREPFCFDFFQAVRLLERLMPDREPVGQFVNPPSEVARFGSHSSITFPPSQIHSIDHAEGEPARMTVNFMGLTGPVGVLPYYYTEQVLHRVRARDGSLRDFLDIFNHRIISLFFQAWQKYRFTVAYERGERDRFSHDLLELIGLGTPGLQARQTMPDDSLIYYAGLLAQCPRSASALRQVLTDYFEVPVEIEQFAGRWFKLDEETQCCFEDGDSVSEQLSVGAVVGDEIWDQQSSVRVKMGPLTLAQYQDFLPEGTAYHPLRGLLAFFSGNEFDFEVQLILRREEVPACELGAEPGSEPRLGWITWMKSAPFSRDPGDTILQIS
jgi:type VI secretion system protein ImpH